MPPVHPAVVHFPIALVAFSVIADAAALWIGSAGLAAAGFWSLVAAALTGAVTIAAGYYDMSRAALSPEADGLVHLHRRIGWVLLAAILLLTLWRWRLYASGASDPGLLYVLAALLVLALTSFQGWYGSEMVYTHGVSVAPTGQGTEPAPRARRRLLTVYKALGAPHGGGHGQK
jgi:uncharacterized membrane protein